MNSYIYRKRYVPSFNSAANNFCKPIIQTRFVEQSRPSIIKQQIIEIPVFRQQRKINQLITKPKRESFYHYTFPQVQLPHEKHVSGYGRGVYTTNFAGKLNSLLK